MTYSFLNSLTTLIKDDKLSIEVKENLQIILFEMIRLNNEIENNNSVLSVYKSNLDKEKHQLYMNIESLEKSLQYLSDIMVACCIEHMDKDFSYEIRRKINDFYMIHKNLTDKRIVHECLTTKEVQSLLKGGMDE